MTYRPSDQLLEFLSEHHLPWLYYDEESDRLTFIIDNYLAADYRGCAAHFMLAHVEGWHQKGGGGDITRSWPLDFGIMFHKLMEYYYKYFRSPDFDLQKFAIEKAYEYWVEMKMDVHLTHKECQQMGGYPGFAGMLIQYATQFKAENENIRVLASEVGFGRAKEVPLYVWTGQQDEPVWYPFDVYLAGRIDIIADDGYRILPLDHKTMGRFYGDPLQRFLIDEGPTGYVYALKKVLPSLIPDQPELALKRDCNRISMNLISKSVPKEGSRFKRLLLYKSDAQLEAYRWRMVATCQHLLSDLELFVRGMEVPRDTSKCQNWYFRPCDFFDIHRQADKSGEQNTLANGFVRLPLWNTENVAPAE